MSGVATGLGRRLRRRAEGAGQGHPLEGAQGSLFWGKCFIYEPERGLRLLGSCCGSGWPGAGSVG